MMSESMAQSVSLTPEMVGLRNPRLSNILSKEGTGRPSQIFRSKRDYSIFKAIFRVIRLKKRKRKRKSPS